MKMPTITMPYVLAGAAVAGLLLWVNVKGAKGAGQAIASGAIDLADGIISEPVNIAGEVFGIPRTNLTECERAKLEGRTWDASFACPAGDFLKYVFK